MKGLDFVSFLLISISAVTCETPDLVLAPCTDAKIVSEVSDRLGTIQFYNQEKGFYYVRHNIPNSYDSVIVGVFCNLPEEFKKTGLTVRYSGKYREREKGNNPVPVGTETYTLELTQIIHNKSNNPN